MDTSNKTTQDNKKARLEQFLARARSAGGKRTIPEATTTPTVEATPVVSLTPVVAADLGDVSHKEIMQPVEKSDVEAVISPIIQPAAPNLPKNLDPLPLSAIETMDVTQITEPLPIVTEPVNHIDNNEAVIPVAQSVNIVQEVAAPKQEVKVLSPTVEISPPVKETSALTVEIPTPIKTVPTSVAEIPPVKETPTSVVKTPSVKTTSVEPIEEPHTYNHIVEPVEKKRVTYDHIIEPTVTEKSPLKTFLWLAFILAVGTGTIAVVVLLAKALLK